MILSGCKAGTSPLCILAHEGKTMAKLTREQIEALGLSPEHLPRHVAMIMDGNGRWAKARSLPRALGHRAGVTRLKGIIRLSSDLGIEALSLFAFSTENWKRPVEEIDTLCSLFVEFFIKEFDELHENHVRIRSLGDISKFPPRVSGLIRDAEEKTAANDGLKLNIAMNYGSRDEILRAARLAAAEPGGVTQESFERHLYTADSPELDLLIRTSGEQRLSNFLLYQASYAELIFTEDFWPDFSDERYVDVLRQYARRSRRFGGLEDTKQ